jgi:hypothetical protein
VDGRCCDRVEKHASGFSKGIAFEEDMLDSVGRGAVRARRVIVSRGMESRQVSGVERMVCG